MNTRQLHFILAAEELSISKAAERAFTSHQNISNSIKYFEEKYGVPMFYRKPRLMLTPQGEKLLYSLRQIEQIENNLNNELARDNEQSTGVVRVGIPDSRYNIWVPDFFPKYHRRYPNVRVEIVSDFSSVLEKKMKSGDLDFLIGMGTFDESVLDVQHLMTESFLVVISHSLIMKINPGCTDDIISKYKKGVILKDFDKYPFILYPGESRLAQAMMEVCKKSDIELKCVLSSNNPFGFPALCQKDVGAAVVSVLFSPQIKQLNAVSEVSNPLYAFPLLGIDSCNTISLVTHKQRFFAKYQIALIEEIINVFENYKREYSLFNGL